MTISIQNKAEHCRRLVILLVTILFALFLIQFNQVEKAPILTTEGRSFEKAQVIQIIRDNIQEDGSRVGAQTVLLQLNSGAHKGMEVEASSSSSYLYGADCTVGMHVIANISESNGNMVVTVYSYDRSLVLYAIVALFLVTLWLIGGRQGINAALGLIFTFVCILFLYLPMLYKGYSPFWAAVLVAALTTVVTMYLIGGVSVKTAASILGTVLGVVIAGVFATVFGYFAKISGYNVSDIEDLVFVGAKTDIQIGGLLFSGILIAALGAVMDVSMSIASTISELHETNPSMNAKALFRSGIHVGKDMMGTMSNTLILAFTGSSINTLIFIYAYDYDYHQVINLYSIGIEIIQGISSTMGVILTVPLVSLISAWMIGRQQKNCHCQISSDML